MKARIHPLDIRLWFALACAAFLVFPHPGFAQTTPNPNLFAGQPTVLREQVTGGTIGDDPYRPLWIADASGLNGGGLNAVLPTQSFTANAQTYTVDAGGAAAVSLNTSGTYVATIQAQWSNTSGGPAYAGVCFGSTNTGTTNGSTSITSVGAWVCPAFGRYLTLTTTAYTSGTMVVQASLMSQRPGYPGSSTITLAPTSSTTATITPSVSAGTALTSLVAKASAGNYYDFYCRSTVAGNCIVYNGTAAPGAGALTAANVLDCAYVAAGGSGGGAYGDIPRRASTGIVVLFSSSTDCNTYTVSSTAYLHASVQ